MGKGFQRRLGVAGDRHRRAARDQELGCIREEREGGGGMVNLDLVPSVQPLLLCEGGDGRCAQAF